MAAKSESIRLKAALAAGSNPRPSLVDTLVARCGIEPDFFVRDMLTWALTRYSPKTTVPRLIAELDSELVQARSQALHTLSKIKDAGAWSSIPLTLLSDADQEVAQSAWRAAVILVPEDEKMALADKLAEQFGRGDREMRLSLSSALVSLGEVVISPVLRRAMASNDASVRAHAQATRQLLQNPDACFQLSINQVKRILGPCD